MSKRALTILLFISLAFNMAVLGTILWMRLHLPNPPHRHFEGNEQAMLPEHLRELQRDPHLRVLRNKYDQHRIQLMRELAQADFQESRATTIIDSSLVAQCSLEQALGYRLVDLRKQMSTAEAEQFFNERALLLERRNTRIHNKHERRYSDEENHRNKPCPDNGHRYPAGSKSR